LLLIKTRIMANYIIEEIEGIGLVLGEKQKTLLPECTKSIMQKILQAELIH